MAHHAPPMDHPSLPPRHHHPPNGHLPPPPSQSGPQHSPHPRQPPSSHQNGVSPSTSHRAPAGPPRLPPPPPPSSLQRLAQANEETWILVGNLAEQMNDPDRAESAYEHALRHNPDSERALTQVASIARSRDDFVKAIDFFQRALDVRQENGEVWSALGHCYLMQDDLQKAYAAYQQALYHLPNPKDPKLWYGIGILYDRYGSLDNAEEAFASVLRMDAHFEKAEEILFRLGIIYKQQQKYTDSLDCFDRILRNPPAPLANLDIWFQIGHVYEQAKNYEQAKEAYERVLTDSPNHAKVLQQLGWLYHQSGSSFCNQDMAIQCLTKSLEADSGDAQSWYLLGRAYMAVQKYQKAYEAYQQAVYRDGRNPTFWCSIGVLYYNINQYRDALDAYSRAIRINPYIPEVWFDLGSLYESCNNQISDAIDAYARAADLDQNNVTIKTRLRLLKDVQANGGAMPAAPGPQDVHPTAYASGHGPPSMIMGHGPHTPLASSASGPPQHHRHPSGHSRSNSHSRGPVDHPMNGGSSRDLPAPSPSMRGGGGSGGAPPGARRGSNDMYAGGGGDPFRNGPHPLNLDESGTRRGSGGAGAQPHTHLAPIDVPHGGPPSHYPEPPRGGGGPPPATNGGPPPPPPLHHPTPIQPIGEMQPPQPLPSMSSRVPYDDGPQSASRRHSPPADSPRVGGGGGRRPGPNTAPSPAPPVPYASSSSYSREGGGGRGAYPNQGLPPPITSAHHGLPYDRATATSTAQPERHEAPWDRRHNRNDSRNGGSMDGPPPPQPPAAPFRSPALTAANGGPARPPSASYGPPPHHAARPPSAHSYDRRVPSPNVGRAEHPGMDRRETRSPYRPEPPYSNGPQQQQQQWSPPSRRQSPPRRYDPRFDGEPPRRHGPPDWEREHPDGPTPQQQQPPPPLDRSHPSVPPPDRSFNNTTPDVKQQRAPAPVVPAAPPPLVPIRASESPHPHSSSARNTAEPPREKERKRRGPNRTDKDVDSSGASTPKPAKEKKERKPPTKRGAAAAKQSLVEKEEGDRGSVAPATSPTSMQAPPFKAPSVHKSPTQWASAGAPPPPQVHRVNRSVDEDYDEEEPEREDGHGGAAAALMGLAGYRTDKPAAPAPTLPPLAHPRTVSNGRLESLLNGPSSKGSDQRSNTPSLKRGASDEHADGTERKRSRIDSNGSTTSSGSPPHLGPILSRGPAPPPLVQSRRASADSGRWAPEEERRVSSTSPGANKASPHSLPPIATLGPAPVSPAASKAGPMHLDGPRLPSPPSSAKHSPIADSP